MRGQPIPQRIPPLTWRKPAFLWTPIALALAIGWPAALFYQEPSPQRFAIASLFVVFAIALISLGASWLAGHPPKTRRVAVLHVVTAGAIAALLAPFVLTWLLSLVAEYEHEGASEHFSLAMSFATTPLVVMLGLPVVLISGILFAWIALKRGVPARQDDFRHDVQPFR
jgi:MFS family permease